LAIYDQAIWHLSRFERPASSIRGLPSVFGDHFHPIIALFAPLFWVAPSARDTDRRAGDPARPVGRAGVSVCPRSPAIRTGVRHVRRVRPVLGMQQTAISDVHEAAFAPLAVACCSSRWSAGSGRVLAAAVFVLAVKEDLAPFLVFVGGYLFVGRAPDGRDPGRVQSGRVHHGGRGRDTGKRRTRVRVHR